MLNINTLVYIQRRRIYLLLFEVVVLLNITCTLYLDVFYDVLNALLLVNNYNDNNYNDAIIQY